VDEVEAGLMKRVPAKYLVDAHHWLILHGRYVCQARTPQCWQCGVRDCCDFKPKTLCNTTGQKPERRAAIGLHG
jgi:endonuclease-3